MKMAAVVVYLCCLIFISLVKAQDCPVRGMLNIFRVLALNHATVIATDTNQLGGMCPPQYLTHQLYGVLSITSKQGASRSRFKLPKPIPICAIVIRITK